MFENSNVCNQADPVFSRAKSTQSCRKSRVVEGEAENVFLDLANVLRSVL